MKILNIEDDSFKHYDICNVIKSCCAAEIEWAKNLKEGIEKIEEAQGLMEMFNLVITDMYYPFEKGEKEINAGEILIQKMTEMKIKVPIILCSSANFCIPEIFGTIHYSQNENWEDELRNLILKVKISIPDPGIETTDDMVRKNLDEQENPKRT